MSALFAGLLPHHVLGVPVGPVRVCLTDPLLVLTVRRTTKRLSQIARGGERRRGRVDPAGEPRRDLLQEPAVAVRIAEGGERPVAAVGRSAATAGARVRVVEPAAGLCFVERLADLDPVRDQLVARSLEVGDDQVQVLGRARRRRGEVRAELDRAAGARRRELDDAEVVTGGEVGVEPPAEASVELLRAVDIRDGDDHHLELHVGRPGAHGVRCGPAPHLGAAHVDLLWVGHVGIGPR
jgi:hypothetical protein